MALTAPLIKANFDPDEARIPKGDPHGGEWTTGGGGKDASVAKAGDANLDDDAYQDRRHDAVAAGTPDDLFNDAPHNENDNGLHPATSSDPFHDAVEDYIVRAIKGSGGIAVQQVRFTSIATGITAVSDILAMSPTGFLFVVDVKTGRNPGFTFQQSYVYPLMDLGGHVYSSDPRISSFGFTPGQPLPPICVYTAYARAPGSLIVPGTFSTNPDCR